MFFFDFFPLYLFFFWRRGILCKIVKACVARFILEKSVKVWVLEIIGSLWNECLLLEIVKMEREREASFIYYWSDNFFFFLLKNDVLVYWIYIYTYSTFVSRRWKYKIIYSPHARSMNVQIVSLSVSAVGLFFIFNLTHWLQTTLLYNEIEFWTDTWKKKLISIIVLLLLYFISSSIRRV